MPEGPAALLHFILLTALQIWVADTLGGGLAVGGGGWGWVLRELIAWPFKHNVEEPSIVLCPYLHLVIIIERKFTSIIAYTVLANNFLFVWSICLAIWKTFLPPWPKPSCVLLQGLVSFEPCRLLLYSFIHLFIPPPGCRSPLVVLEEMADFGGSIQQRVLQLWPNCLRKICSISCGTSISSGCSWCSRHF